MILKCNILCFNEKEQNLTGNSEDIWLPICIDLDYIFAVKENGIGEHSGKATMWHKSGDYFIIDLDYEDALTKWMNATGKVFYFKR